MMTRLNVKHFSTTLAMSMWAWRARGILEALSLLRCSVVTPNRCSRHECLFRLLGVLKDKRSNSVFVGFLRVCRVLIGLSFQISEFDLVTLGLVLFRLSLGLG